MFVDKMLIPPQRDIPERLDLAHGSIAEVRRSLHDIRRINRFLGGTPLSIRGCLPILRRACEQRGHATLLDVGSGLGDVAAAIVEAAAHEGLDVRAVGLDLSARHLLLARDENPQVLGARGDAFRLPMRDGGVDVVHSSLFLHHFRPPEIQSLLREFSRVARVGWFMNDITRHTLPLWFFRTTWPIFARSPLTRYDGTVSIRRAYTPREMQQVVAPIVGARAKSRVPFRVSVAWQAASTSR